RHNQENHKTGSNQSSRKKKNSSSSSSRNNNIISNRQMTGLKRQKPTAECPRNVRGSA
ncbi:TPA: pilus assembly protein, partial [Escherichia coli]|nr:pilus assembly protein [Escherichia coli]EGM7878667.1 pilus assembly protein [Escherichia coli]